MSTADKSSQTLIFCNIPQIHKLALHIFSIIVASLILSSLVEVRRPRLLQHTMQLILKTISCQIAKHNWSHRDSGIQLEAFYSLETFFQVSILIFIYLFLFLWWQGSNPGAEACQACVLLLRYSPSQIIFIFDMRFQYKKCIVGNVQTGLNQSCCKYTD